jgi:large subunit ribosomal protein L32
MTIRMRHTKSHTKNRRSHHGLKRIIFAICEKCGETKLPHRVCQNCGTYSKRPVIDVLKKLTKKEKKKKEKELQEQETEQSKSKPLDAATLSKK